MKKSRLFQIRRPRNKRGPKPASGGIIIIAGLYVLIQSFRQESPAEKGRGRREAGGGGGCLSWLKELGQLISDPGRADRDYSGCIEAGEAAVLGLALTLNNLANGFAAGMLGLSPATGVMLILLGIHEMFQ